jgi:hypothetical protein
MDITMSREEFAKSIDGGLSADKQALEAWARQMKQQG